MITWESVTAKAFERFSQLSLGQEYLERLKFEIAEIEKQGAEAVWITRLAGQKRFASNPNSLVILWLLGMVDDDPMVSRKTPILNTVRASKVLDFKDANGVVPHDIIKDYDSPDIDIDCLPSARTPLKEYAISEYGQNCNDGYGSVCSVGTWQTYKFKSALADAAVSMGWAPRGHNKAKKKKKDTDEVERPTVAYRLNKIDTYTAVLPDDVDELKEGGKAACKGRIQRVVNGVAEDVECGELHDCLECPKCKSKDTDGPTIAKLLEEHEQLRVMNAACPPVYDENGALVSRGLIDIACNLIGRIRNMGMHAGAIIIADRPLYGNVPLAKSGSKGFWVSMWTEGRNSQLSKFGYIKWDWLGLKTLEYIFRCCQMIKENRGISFGDNMEGMDYNNPRLRHAGYYFDGNGKKCFIDMDDKHALALANEQKTDGVFQFDTDLAKSILANQSYCFEDLMLFNAMGHPGPMQSIPEAVKNRGDTRGLWKKRMRPEFLRVLGDTYGIICYQEQLQQLWQNIAGFTSPEAQEARKAVAKKHTHKFKPIEAKWLAGASKLIGEQEAIEWWGKMVTFGRYAFNRSHAVSYCLVAQKCLWLKAHFAPEFWASVMSDCHPEKLVRYMGVARAEGWKPTDITYCGTYKGNGVAVSGVKFAAVNIENLVTNFSVSGDTVNQGLIGVKGIGDAAAKIFQGRGTYANIDEFVTAAPGRQAKLVMERFIKLGAFSHLPGHENARAIWYWYLYKYCNSGTVEVNGATVSIAKYRQHIRSEVLLLDGWNERTIAAERDRQIAEWKRQFPKRTKVPDKLKRWLPEPHVVRSRFTDLYPDDFTLVERLGFQKSFLGYWIDSPLDIYETNGGYTIAAAKEAAKLGEVKLEGIITNIDMCFTKNNKVYVKVFLTDGIQETLIFIWQNEAGQDKEVMRIGTGVSMFVDYDAKRNTFSLARGESISPLSRKKTC